MERIRARDLGIPFEGVPGKFNSITDVAGVTVGHTTLISGEGMLNIGKGPVRTGVTAIRPRGDRLDPVFAAWYSLNGCGEMTGALWVEESGELLGPVMITNTQSVNAVREAVTLWMGSHYEILFALPVVAETYDGFLNDIKGSHVKDVHAISALENAKPGSVHEGNVGGGTGMICHGFKGGIGTASRTFSHEDGGYTIGVLVQANHGRRHNLQIAGIPVGNEFNDLLPRLAQKDDLGKNSSIIVIVATDCPLLPHQLKRLARRVPQGIARTGGMGENYSGDIFLAFSTTNINILNSGLWNVDMFPNEKINPLFEGTVQATEEAIINAMIAAETMVGINDNQVFALPQSRLQDILFRYNRL